MRKILLGTTAVVGAALIGATTAQAQEAPTVRVGGFMATMYNWVQDDADRAVPAPRIIYPGTNTSVAPVDGVQGVAGAGRVARSKNDFRNEVEIQVFVTGKAANGMSYGATIEIQNDNVGGGSGSALDLDEAYVFVSSPTLGTIRFGEEDAAASLMQVRLPTITGMGPDGDWGGNMLAAPGTLNSQGPSFITGINDGNDATKIIYLSPQFFGIDVGFSYAPSNTGEGERSWFGRTVDTLNVTSAGLVVSNLQRDPIQPRDAFSGAIRYRGSFSNVGINAGFGAQFANGATSSTAGLPQHQRNISAYTLGLQLTAFGFTVGGEYTWGNYSGGSVGRSSLATGRDASSHYALGVTYVMGAMSFGAFWGEATQDNGANFSDRQQSVWGFGAAYTLAPGLELFGSYNHLQDQNVLVTSVYNAPAGATPATTSVTRALNRDADVILLGMRLAF
jgi:predicted porin